MSKSDYRDVRPLPQRRKAGTRPVEDDAESLGNWEWSAQSGEMTGKLKTAAERKKKKTRTVGPTDY